MDTITDVEVASYTIPTEAPESDGTLTWDHTTVVVVHVTAAGERGIGFTYGPGACGSIVDEVLADVVRGRDPFDVPAAWSAMVRAIRNSGRPGVCSMAIAAVDIALWDLHAKLLGLPLVRLLGAARDSVPLYGSGGFTSLSECDLVDQLGSWVAGGFERVKMKIGTRWGRDEEADLRRVALVREAIGGGPALFVDANGGYSAKQSVRLARRFELSGVSWFEEPVSSDDLSGLARIRDAISIDVAAGEYGYDLAYFARMCAAGAVDVLQADVSRCAGITEWRRAAAVAAAHGLEISGHCAPSLHAHVAAATPNLAHVEYFADHARVDRILFDGVLDPVNGALHIDPSRPGIGLELKERDAQRFAT
ncbi:MAG TPA: enolase C-terminal domain-like protein [Acidimicrobiia bacterium]|jgi:L-alanine-DL-glutamate epimerase-like enolase superfamily enzyme